MRSPRFRLPGILLALLFTANAVLPGLPHGCQGGMGGASAPVAAGVERAAPHHGGGHHQPDQPTERQPGTCECIGMSCCGTGLSLPATSSLTVAPAEPAAYPVVFVVLPAPLPRADHLLPPSQGPPIQS